MRNVWKVIRPRHLTVVTATAVCLCWPFVANAKKRAAPAELIGTKLVTRVKPERGFVDNPFTFDTAGGRLVYINADAANLASIRVLDLAQDGVQLSATDISGFTTTPTHVEIVLDGNHYFVVSRSAPNAPATGALIEQSGKVLRKFGPAQQIVLTEVEGNPAAVAYSAIDKQPRKGLPEVHHTVEAFSIETGKRIGRKSVLVADQSGRVKKLDFRLNHWANGYARAVGIRGGKWDRKENQRSPDHEAWYSMIRRNFVKELPITSVHTHHLRMKALASHNNEAAFLMVAPDLSGIQLALEGRFQAVEIEQPFHHYDPRSLEYHRLPDGTLAFTLTIDPVNADAVARKVADPVYVDLYHLAPGSTKAKRRARKLAPDKQRHFWQSTNDYWVLVTKHAGFDRGGKELLVYQLN